MQDSIEDYIQISKNKKQLDPKLVSKEVVLTAEIKKQCHARAMKIVEFCIEGKLHPEVLLRSLPYIDQTYFQDIVEERAISHLCGYPICGKKIPPMPNKQYHISTKENKVYDITERKNYCSNFCYKAGLHIKNQVDTSPLWLRKPNDLPKYNLLSSTVKGLPGKEVDQGIAKPVLEPSFTSVSSFTQCSLTDMIHDEIGEKRNQHQKVASKATISKISVTPMETIKEDCGNENQNKIASNPIKCTKKTSEVMRNETTIEETEIEVVHTKEGEAKDTQLQDGKKRHGMKVKKSSKKKTSATPSTLVSVDSENHMKKCLSQWFTLETYTFLYGEDQIKTMVTDKKIMELFTSMKMNEHKQIQEQKYIEICQKLQLKELAEDMFDKTVLASSSNTNLEPPPDYTKLKEESKYMDLKVKSFYGGALYEREDSKLKNTELSAAKKEEEEGPPAVLPLIDTKSQNALRRKIFLTSLKKAMQMLLQKLRIPHLAIISDLQSLVKTFELQADNIVFKPHIWNYISIVLLKVLSLRDAEIHKALEVEPGALEYINLVLSELPSSHGLLEYALNLSKDFDFFIKKYLNSNQS